MKPLPAHYNGIQKFPNGTQFELWTITQPLGPHPTYSTLSRESIESHGYYPVPYQTVFNVRICNPAPSLYSEKYVILADSLDAAIETAKGMWEVCKRDTWISEGTHGMKWLWRKDAEGNEERRNHAARTS